MLSTPEKSRALQELKDDSAQILIDFMYAVSTTILGMRPVSRERLTTLSSQQALSQPVKHPPEPQLRKDVLIALYGLLKTSLLYPHWYVLKNTVHQLYEDASGGFCDIHRGNNNGLDVCVKIVRINQPTQMDHMFKVFLSRSPQYHVYES